MSSLPSASVWSRSSEVTRAEILDVNLDQATRGLLARKRPGLFDAYDLGNWERALEQRFVIDDRQALPSGTRTIYRCRPR